MHSNTFMNNKTTLELTSKALAGRSDLHIARKVWHVSMGTIAIALYHASDSSLEFYGWVAFAIGLAGFILDFFRLHNEGMNLLAVKLFGLILRKSEIQSFSGLPFYAMGSALSIYFFPPKIALVSIYFLVYADPIASLIGVKFGKDQILPNKTLQGSVACFLACYAIMAICTLDSSASSHVVLIFCFFAALFGTVSEMFSAFNIDDNMTIPVVSGAGIFVLNLLFQVL